MSRIEFYKYHGCGNDFILIDNRENNIHLSNEEIANICHRRFGIGGDGLMFLGLKSGFDFSMKYYNSDGNPSSFCGNGGRCIVQFAIDLGIVKSTHTFFEFEDTKFTAKILPDNRISLSMIDVFEIKKITDTEFEIQTGSPHYVKIVEDINLLDIVDFGRKIRYSESYPKGINVNTVKIISNQKLEMKTYERGVEDETYSCGTGVVAATLVFDFYQNGTENKMSIMTKGGDFEVSFDKISSQNYQNIKLIGPAKFVFKGVIHL